MQCASVRGTVGEHVPSPAVPDPADVSSQAPVMIARQLAYRYGDARRVAVDGVDFSLQAKDRVLLQGRSGSGKSTLAALQVGLRHGQTGALLWRGLDMASLGASGWSRAAVAAPQFNENHVFTDTLAFNLLMGRRWPPRPEDIEDAETLCHELGLGGLLEQMPAGLMQIVGDGGWQLSHGERSRVYLARALLQQAELIVLDESFGALDPDNLDRCLRVAIDRASVLVVVAQP